MEARFIAGPIAEGAAEAEALGCEFDRARQRTFRAPCLEVGVRMLAEEDVFACSRLLRCLVHLSQVAKP